MISVYLYVFICIYKELYSTFELYFMILAMSFEIDSKLLIDLIEKRNCQWDLTIEIPTMTNKIELNRGL